MSRSAEAHAHASPVEQPKETGSASPPPLRSTFEDLGVRPSVAEALRSAFPNIQAPTDTQRKLIPTVLEGRDILLKDVAGTGKTFGLVLALLSKPRIYARAASIAKKRSITTLFVVPHRDLAFQVLHWVQRLSEAAGAHSDEAQASVAQCLIRGGTIPLDAQIQRLHAIAPHILVATPQAVMDVVEKDMDALQLESLSTVVVDEVDYLVEAVQISASKAFMEKARRKLDKHISPTRQLLDGLYASRIERRSADYGDDAPVVEPQVPQLIMSSATLRKSLRLFVKEAGWFEGSKVKRLEVHSQRERLQRQLPVKEGDWRADGRRYYALVVTEDGEIRNIDGAVAAPSDEDVNPSESSEEDTETTEDTLGDEVAIPSPLDPEMQRRFEDTPSPFNDAALEAVATAFALDVPSVALLILPASAPLQRAVYELQQLGVNAHGLDLLASDRGRTHLLRAPSDEAQEVPTLLVATYASIRGLDMPELSHVFILGVPEGDRRVDVYLQVAGRVGRFGRKGGKVISVVQKPAPLEDAEEGKVDPKDEVWKMKQVYKALDIVPTQLEHFD